MNDKLKVRVDPHEAGIVDLPSNPIPRLRELGRLASYLDHNHKTPPISRRGLVKRAEEHQKNTGQVGTVIFN